MLKIALIKRYSTIDLISGCADTISEINEYIINVFNQLINVFFYLNR